MPRILHLGLGAFHRAHQAVFLQRLHRAGDREWTLASGNIRADGAEVIDALSRSSGAFTLETVSPRGERQYERIESISEVVPLDAAWAAFVRLGAQPQTRIISFTVTEAGYSSVGAEPPLLFQLLASMLHARMESGAGPVTLLCCDNLRHNGRITHDGLMAVARARSAALAAWIEANTRCPGTMVDRITPRPTAEVRARVKDATGIDDAAAVMAESWLQWVIEDDFIAGRPKWEAAGAEMVADVVPYEEAKIRLLNAAHSCLAWGGTLADLSFVHEDATDDGVRRFAFDYATHDAIPALRPSPVDLERYRDSVLERFANAALRDTNERIFADSCTKLATFIAPTIADALANGRAFDAAAILPALYLGCLRRFAAGRLPYAYSDPALDAAGAKSLCAAPDPVAALAQLEHVWGRWAGDARLVDALRRADAKVGAFEQSRARS
ncbi:MAG TPA: mannitol dehydrogenase family protein [Ramlibacter sp.]|nr:mannitol dehydrogenase family protein [Ramlibacter sp.]